MPNIVPVIHVATVTNMANIFGNISLYQKYICHSRSAAHDRSKSAAARRLADDSGRGVLHHPDELECGTAPGGPGVQLAARVLPYSTREP